jgi:hypothetical protein
MKEDNSNRDLIYEKNCMLFTYEDILRAAMNLFPQINWKLTF